MQFKAIVLVAFVSGLVTANPMMIKAPMCQDKGSPCSTSKICCKDFYCEVGPKPRENGSGVCAPNPTSGNSKEKRGCGKRNTFCHQGAQCCSGSCEPASVGMWGSGFCN